MPRAISSPAGISPACEEGKSVEASVATKPEAPATPANDYLKDTFEFPRISPAPFEFGPGTTAATFQLYLDVSRLSPKDQQKELSSRLFALLRAVNFEVSALVRRNDLAELSLKLAAVRAQPSSMPLLNRFHGYAKEGRSLLNADNKAKLESACERVSQAIKEKQMSSEKLAATLSVPIPDLAQAERLVNLGGRITEDREKYVWLLQCRVLTGTAATISLMARAGLDFNLPDRDGQRPLHCAALRGELTCLMAVLSAGADANLSKLDGTTPLHLARDENVIKALIGFGANPNSKTERGSTPLHAFCRKAALPEVLALLGNGADPNLADNFGATPLSEARFFGSVEIENALIQYGAKRI